MKPTFNHHRSNRCPKCGREKDYRSKLCQECGRKTNPGIDHSKLTPEWLYSFTGLFMGEGSVGIYFDKRSRGSYHARCAIKLRSDDRPLLNDIQSRLGGRIYNENARGRSNPALTWATTDTAHLYGVVCLLIEYSVLPAKKLGDLLIVKEFCEWRMSQPYRVSDWSIAAELQSRLLKIRGFSEGG